MSDKLTCFGHPEENNRNPTTASMRTKRTNRAVSGVFNRRIDDSLLAGLIGLGICWYGIPARFKAQSPFD
jgi:hypothetical protein